MRGLNTRWAVLLGVLPLLLVTPASAQDDWSLTRDPAASRSQRKPANKKPRSRGKPGGRRRANKPRSNTLAAQIERYAERLAKQPDDLFAFDRMRGLLLQRDGTLEPAIVDYRKLVEADPESPSARMVLAQLLAAARRYELADPHFVTVRAAMPKSSAAALAHARVLTKLQRTDSARAAYELVASSASSRDDKREALGALAALDMDAGDVQAARKRYVAIVRLDKGNSFAETAFARALSDRGRHAEAAAELLALARGKKGDARAAGPLYRDVAREQLLAGDAAAAIDSAGKGLGKSGGDVALAGELYDVLTEAHRRRNTLADLGAELNRKAGRRFQLVARTAAIWDELGDQQRAIKTYRRAIKLSPRHIDTRLALARLLSRAGQLEKVIREYRELTRIAPDEPRFVIAIADLLVQVGRAEEAREVATRASRDRPKDAGLHRAIAELYVRWGRGADAQRELELLTRIEPDEASHWIALGTQRLEDGDKAGAREAWDHLLKVPGDAAEAHATLAGVLADHDQLGDAMLEIEKARTARPGDVGFERDYASLLERSSRAADSEAAWLRVLRSDKADRTARQEARQHLVVLWKRTGALGRRMVALDERFQSEEPDLEAGRTLAEAYARGGQGKLVNAAAVLERIVQLSPSDVGSLRALERVYTQLGRAEQALGVLERLVEVDVARAQSYLRRGVEVALSAYLDERALRLAQRAVELDPSQAEAHRLLGDLYRGQQELELAAQAYDAALRLDPTQFGTALVLAEVELARGRVRQADAALFAVVSGSPDDELVARAGRAALQLHMGSDSLEVLERRLLPLALERASRPVYRRVLVEIYGAWLGPGVRRAQAGGSRSKGSKGLKAVGKRAIKPLLEALSDADPTQRGVALELLGALGNPNAVEPLLTLAESGKDGAERGRALIAAGSLGEPRALDRLASIASGPERRLRPLAVWGIAHTGGRGASERLRGLLDAPDAPVRLFAALGLGHLRAKGTAKELAALAMRERHADVRAAAIWALAASGGRAHRDMFVAGLSGPTPVAEAALLGLASDRKAIASGLFVQRPAQQRLALRLMADRTARRLLAQLPPPTWPLSMRSYLHLLTAQNQPPAGAADLGPMVEPLAHAGVAALREGGDRALAALDLFEGREKGVAVGDMSLGIADWGAKRCGKAVKALDRLGAKLAPALGDLAQGGDPELRGRAAVLLARTGVGGSEEALREAMRGASEQRRMLFDAMAGASGVPRKLRKDALRVALEDPSWSVRVRALTALGAPQNAEEAAVLARVLREDAFASVREAAARAASQAPRKLSAPVLALAEGDVEARVAAVARAARSGSAGAGGRRASHHGECASAN